MKRTSGKSGRLRRPKSITGRHRGAAQDVVYRTFYECAPLGIVSLDAAGRFLNANPAFVSLLGYPEDQLRGMSFGGITYPEDLEAAEGLFERLRRGELETVEVEKRYVRADQRVIWARVVVAAVRDARGRLARTVGMIQDITDRKLAEEALSHSSRRFEKLVNSVNGIVWECDANDFRFDFVSPKARELLGYPIQEWYETPNAWIKHLHPEDRDSAIGYCIEQTRAKRDHTFEYRMIAADGRVVWLRDLVTVVLEEGRPSKLRGVMIDVTLRKQAEEALQRLSFLIASTDDAIIATDPGGKITNWNGGAETLYGYSAQEAIGRDVFLIVPPERLDHAKGIRAALERGERIPRFEAPGLRKDGSRVEMSMMISPMLDSEGRFLGAASISHDITQRKRAEAEIRELNAELEARVRRRTEDLAAANRELEAFNRSVSHDLRAPLRAVEAFSQIVLREHAQGLDPEGLKLFGRICKAAERMRALIDDLLRLSRASAAAMSPQVVDLSRLAEEVLAELRRLEPQRGVETSIAPGLFVFADAALAKAVMQNLVGNAWKFTRKTERPRIEVGAVPREGMLECYVRDNGAGFASERAPDLFCPFTRLHSAEEFEGTGLGLAIVRRAVERHGGKAWAEGAVGRGATVFFTLPGSPPGGKAGGRGGIRTPEGR